MNEKALIKGTDRQLTATTEVNVSFTGELGDSCSRAFLLLLLKSPSEMEMQQTELETIPPTEDGDEPRVGLTITVIQKFQIETVVILCRFFHDRDFVVYSYTD